VFKIAGIAGVVTAVMGFLMMNQLGRYRVGKAMGHVHRIKGNFTRVPDDTPRFKIIVNSSPGGDISAADLAKCQDQAITWVTQSNAVRCVEVSSPEGMALLKMDPVDRPIQQDPLNGIQQQGFAATPEAIAQDVSSRPSGIQQYCEVIFFALVYLGVMLRIYWDVYLQKRRGRRPTLTVNTLISGLVIAIAVYGTVMQSGLLGKTISFQAGVFATYNGIVWPVILNDIAALRGLNASKPV
jgi:hypothetical protein